MGKGDKKIQKRKKNIKNLGSS